MTMLDVAATTINIKIITKTNNCPTVSSIDDDDGDDIIIIILYKHCSISMCVCIYMGWI